MSVRASDLKSNIYVAKQLALTAESGRVVHAFAFLGGSAEGRAELGNWLAQYLLCSSPEEGPCGECLSCRKFAHSNHEDFIRIGKQDGRESIVKDQILELIDRLSFKPFGGRYVVLIEDAQQMNAVSQNKLLKTLEEPVSEAVMILLSETADGLLPTVLSRCSCYYLESPQAETAGKDAEAAKAFAKLIADGAPFYRKKAEISDIISDKDSGRSRALAFLDVLEDQLRTEAVAAADFGAKNTERQTNAIRQAEICRKYLKQLHSVGYTLKQMCLRV